MAVVEPGDVEAFLAICAKWDVEATVIGEVTDTGRLQIDWHGERIVDVPPRSVAHDGPTYHRPYRRPAWQDALQADGAEALARPTTGDELRETLLRLVASPNLCDKSWITDQYDRYVRGDTDPRPALRQRDDPRRRRHQPRRLGGDRLQRQVRQAGPVRRRPAGARRVLPQRRDRRGDPARDLRLPELRLPEDPDVMWQFARPAAASRTPASSSASRHRRERQPLQPDRRDGDPAHPGGRRARRDGGRHRRTPSA